MPAVRALVAVQTALPALCALLPALLMPALMPALLLPALLDALPASTVRPARSRQLRSAGPAPPTDTSPAAARLTLRQRPAPAAATVSSMSRTAVALLALAVLLSMVQWSWARLVPHVDLAVLPHHAQRRMLWLSANSAHIQLGSVALGVSALCVQLGFALA